LRLGGDSQALEEARIFGGVVEQAVAFVRGRAERLALGQWFGDKQK